MFLQGATDVPCTLLHFVGGELVDVTKGRIVQPGTASTSAPSGPSVSCTPAVGGASTLAELDAIIMVTN